MHECNFTVLRGKEKLHVGIVKMELSRNVQSKKPLSFKVLKRGAGENFFKSFPPNLRVPASAPVLTVEGAEMYCFCDVICIDIVGACHIGDSACDAQNTVVTSAG